MHSKRTTDAFWVLFPVMLFATAFPWMFAGCGGSVSTGTGTTAVTVTIGGGGASAAPAGASLHSTPRPLGAAIPSTVTTIRFTIGGAGIDNIVQAFQVTGSTMTVTLQVPSGPSRKISVEALDSDGTPRYGGSAVVDASGTPMAVTIDLAVSASNPAIQSWNAVADTVSNPSILFRLAKGGGIVLAAGSAGEIFSSTDGIQWTSRTPGNISGDISALAFGDNTFLAMTARGTFTSVPAVWTNHFYAAAVDNVSSWTLRGSVVETFGPLADLDFGGGVFVAVGGDSVFRSADNGATWSQVTIPGVSSLSDVAYGNGRFVATDGAGDNVAVSPDGASWSTVSLGLPLGEAIGRIGFGGGLFLLTTVSGNVYTSPDGESWTGRTRFEDISGLDTGVVRVGYGAGAFLVVTNAPTQIYFSFDSGGSWILVDLSLAGFSIEDVLYWNGAFLAAGGDFAYPSLGHVFRSGDL